MRVLIVLSVLALTRADVGGYNYEGGNTENSYPDSGAANLAAPIGGGEEAPVAAPVAAPAAAPAPAPVAELQKEFFTFTAPEADFAEGDSLHDLASSVKKHLRVIFIKGPEHSGLSNAALNLAKHASGTRTAVYVLQKQSDVAGLAQQLQNINSQNVNKPEVHFVKYRTPEDASNAQHAIQQQYNELGGHTLTHDGGVAPVLNFASRAPVQAAPIQAAPIGGSISAPNNGYIPPSVSNPPPPPPQQPSSAYLPILKV